MSAGAWWMGLVAVLTVAVLAVLVGSLVRHITNERTPGVSVWRQFGLSLVLMGLFFVSWFGQVVSQWQAYTDEQQSLGQSTSIGDFAAEFAQSTYENWQSEFLQLFSFVVLAALYIHKGSAESKDSDEKMEASLRRIEERLGTLPAEAPQGDGDSWKLPDRPQEQPAAAS